LKIDKILENKEILKKYMLSVTGERICKTRHQYYLEKLEPSAVLCDSVLKLYNIDLKHLKYILDNDLSEIVRNCLNCGKILKSMRHKYCSSKCSTSSKEVQEKFKQTCIEKYGADNPWKSEKIKEKIKKTCLEKYGVENSFQAEEVQEKYKQTCIEKYGVDNPNKNEEIRGKFKQTYIEKYGADTPWKSEKIKEKIKQTCIERYGV
jgi:hypothetical protein